MALSESCIFCRIVSGSIPCYRILETEHALAFLDINPIAQGHVLVVPRTHGARLHDLPSDYAAGCMTALHRVARALYADTEYNVLQNNGPMAHQEVPHVHFHLIPKRSASDDEGLVVGWPVQSGPAFKPEALSTLAAEMRAKLIGE